MCDMAILKKWAVYGAVISFVALIVWIYGLGWLSVLPLGAASCLAVWRIRACRLAELQYEYTYIEVTTYLEQLLCSYRRLGHAGKALEDCRLLFEAESPMGKAIAQAKHILLTGEGVLDGNILSAAFACIERRYDSRRMRIIHRFICNGDKTGAESGRSSDILLEDLELWKNRTRMYQNRKKFIKLECGIATGLSLLLCYVSRLLTPEELGFDISESAVYRFSTVGAFLLFLVILVKIFRKLSGSWLDERGRRGERERNQLERMYRVLRGEEAASPLTRHMAKRVVGRYVREEFPYWLLLVTLYLQSESSYQALRYSLEETGGVFRLELERLLREIYDSPRSLEPYIGFFSGLGLSEVQSGMKILYSVNNNGYEESKKQLDFLISQNNRLMDKNESGHQSNRMAAMSMLKQLPMVVSCLKLLVDLVNLLAVTMGSFQNINL